MEWSDRAACSSVPTDLFFPHEAGPGSLNAAKAICASCDVAPECLAYAVRTGQHDGVWGGLSPNERIRLGATG